MKEPKLIYLEWCDAHTNLGWKSAEEVKMWSEETDFVIRECGWLMHETKEYLVFVSALKPENSFEEARFLNTHKIPKTWIRRRIDLTKHIKE